MESISATWEHSPTRSLYSSTKMYLKQKWSPVSANAISSEYFTIYLKPKNFPEISLKIDFVSISYNSSTYCSLKTNKDNTSSETTSAYKWNVTTITNSTNTHQIYKVEDCFMPSATTSGSVSRSSIIPSSKIYHQFSMLHTYSIFMPPAKPLTWTPPK